MTSIKIIANGSSASVAVDGELTSGMVGIPVSIQYDDAWNGLIKTASFRVGSFVRSRENIGTTTTVPWEVMRHSGKVLQVGVEGRDKDGNIVMPTIWASCGTIKDGAVSGIPGAPNPETDIPTGGGAAIDDSAISSESTWSSQNIVNKLCPSFTESGTAVACEPLEGYPLEVISEVPYTEGQPLSSITLTRLGANLIPYPYYEQIRTASGVDFTINEDGSVTLKGTATASISVRLAGAGAAAAAHALPDWIVPGMTYTLSTNADLPSGARIIIYFYDEENNNLGYLQSKDATTGTVFEGAVKWWVFISINKDVTVDHTIYPMLQLGSVSTGYEPYRCEKFTADVNQICTVAKTYDINECNYEVLEDVYEIEVFIDANIDTSVAPVVLGDEDGMWTVRFSDGLLYVYCDPGDYKAALPKYPIVQLQVYESIFDYNWSTGVLTDANGNETQLTAQPITAWDGINTFASKDGYITVTGKKDLVALINKLEATVNALLGG